MILGLIWAFWHLPMYFVETRWPFYISLVIITVLSILFAWAYNNTKGSLIITILFHFCFNFTGVFITEMTPLMIFYIGAGIMIGVWVIIVIIYEGPSKLSKKLDSEMPFSRRIMN
ncbi:MAG: CPBP family intramembrane metalloprotease [Candidatus Lokiarchaeota archaeon]